MSMIASDTAECFALLDDHASGKDERRSRLYTKHAGTISLRSDAAISASLRKMQDALREGKHAVGLFTYELGGELQGIAPRGAHRSPGHILLFEECRLLSGKETVSWLESRRDVADHLEKRPAGIAGIDTGISEEEFTAALAGIHRYLEAGDTYQVNYTYRLRFDAFGSLAALYLRLRSRQPVPYGALISMPDGGAVLSFSPELFVRHAQGELIARPMKGTALASNNPEEDEAHGAALSVDPKTRAENLMIVDLLRNDLGRVAVPGSVQVPDLFTIERYGDVLQMTSTIRACLRDDAALADIFTALYPCGSITGAPKRRTMQIIRELESDARGLYTGAIGWFDTPRDGNSLGDFCLSVPIRTLELQPPGPGGVRKGEMGIGAGIVYDSDAASELAECRLKGRFLTELPNEFELFETMHATHAQGCRHLQRHLRRMRASAAYFGFRFNEEKSRDLLRNTCESLPAEGEHRLRLALDHDGVFSVQTAPLVPLNEPVRILIAPRATTAEDLFLRHKTTIRARYDEAWREAEKRGAFDMVFRNDRGELTEGGRSNIFIKLDGRWYTPPLDAGLLPGVMREVLLSDPELNASEKRLTIDDLHAAQEVLICNALRGRIRAVVDFSA